VSRNRCSGESDALDCGINCGRKDWKTLHGTAQYSTAISPQSLLNVEFPQQNMRLTKWLDSNFESGASASSATRASDAEGRLARRVTSLNRRICKRDRARIGSSKNARAGGTLALGSRYESLRAVARALKAWGSITARYTLPRPKTKSPERASTSKTRKRP
jgi:hypothetical protein